MMTHRVTLKIKDPSFTEGDRVFPGDLDAEGEAVWHVNPAECDHKHSLCMSCVRDWTEGYWATIHFGPEHNLRPSFSLNELVQFQADFVAAAQMLSDIIKPLEEPLKAAKRIVDWAANAVNN